MLKPHDIVVSQRAVNFDLLHQFLLRARLSQSALLNNLGSLDLLVFEVGKLVALGKAALANVFAFEVLAGSNRTARQHNALLHDAFAFFALRFGSH